eukprot:CFRG5973T1
MTGSTVDLDRERISIGRKSNQVDSFDNETQNISDDSRAAEDAFVKECLDWRKQVTVRGVLVGLVVGAVFTVISLKLSLTSGVIPSLNIGAGLLGFVFMQSTVTLLGKVFSSIQIFTQQENTVIQTCAVACSGVSFMTGLGSYMLAMDEQSYLNLGVETPGNYFSQVVNPTFPRLAAYSLVVSLSGIFVLTVMRGIYIIDLRLIYPSGTATGTMIKSFFTEEGQELAKMQFRSFTKWFAVAFFYGAYNWLFTNGDNCGIHALPTFGFALMNYTWYFTFELNYIGVGMLCPIVVSYSMMWGALLGWGILWPIVDGKSGVWYDESHVGNDMQGAFGYKVFIAIALIMGDGMYQLVMMIVTYVEEQKRIRTLLRKGNDEVDTTITDLSNLEKKSGDKSSLSFDDDEDQVDTEEKAALERQVKLMDRVFLEDNIPWYIAAVGYFVCAVAGCIVIPLLFPGTFWYMILISYLFLPIMAVPNAYITGMSDWDMCSTFGKFAIFVFAMWAHGTDGEHGIIAGLATCGVMFAGTSSAATLMQDYRTGYLTFASPRAMFIAQVIGAIGGCFIGPGLFLMFYHGFEVGVPGSEYAAPYGTIYRSMALVGTQGFSVLPQHCLTMSGVAFFLAMFFSWLRDFSRKFFGERAGRYIETYVPMPSSMSIPLYIGAHLAIIMSTGALVQWWWKRTNASSWAMFGVIIASALIAGDGIWALPAAGLSLFGVTPPMCLTVN